MERREVSPPPAVRRKVTLGGGREVLVLLVLLALLSSAGPLFRPLLFLTTMGLLFYGYVRLCFWFGRRVGIAGITVLGVVIFSVAGVQYGYHLKHEELLETLRTYDRVVLTQANVLPSSDVIWVSFKGRVTDEQIAAIVSLDPLKKVTHVFIDQCRATDTALESLDAFPQLSYVFIDSEIITDTAIAEFKERHSDCTVIAYGRR